jgi:hypothetical protein
MKPPLAPPGEAVDAVKERTQLVLIRELRTRAGTEHGWIVRLGHFGVYYRQPFKTRHVAEIRIGADE